MKGDFDVACVWTVAYTRRRKDSHELVSYEVASNLYLMSRREVVTFVSKHHSRTGGKTNLVYNVEAYDTINQQLRPDVAQT